MRKASKSDGGLTIGDVSERTGVSQATLRSWELRHGFPRPLRLESGHRRYSPAEVEAVEDVLRRRERGTRLDIAIEQALRKALRPVERDAPSVHTALRRHDPGLASNRLTKATLLALSWAIEDEVCSRAERPYLFGAFQRQRFFDSAADRWADLSRTAQATFVFADVPSPSEGARIVSVPLAADAPMRREWAIVCDAPRLAVALSAWELPGQDSTRDRDRIFESSWTLDPGAVRVAARTCARIAADAGADGAEPTVEALAVEPPPAPPETATATALFNRVVAYVDRTHTP